jgi:branched-chain amino acid aminotransferase
MAHGTHDFEDDPRNEQILIWVNGELLPRARAVVSVFDSGFVLGDGVWEGLRVSGGHPAFLDQHLDRLSEGATAIMLDIGMTREELTAAIYETLRANDLVDGVHVRRATPDTLDPKLNAHSKLNDITACIQAYTAGADEALMLDPHGFVATCNSTHFFVVVGTEDAPEVLTSDGRYCLAGITRANVLEVCRAHGIPARETTFSLTDVYSAREAFVTGSFAGVVPVRSVDGRTIGDGRRGPVVERIQALYRELVDADVAGRTAP